MAVPKRKQSKSRRDKRRANYYKMDAPAKSVCPNCSAIKLPHRVCPYCGMYKGRSVLQIIQD